MSLSLTRNVFAPVTSNSVMSMYALFTIIQKIQVSAATTITPVIV